MWKCTVIAKGPIPSLKYSSSKVVLHVCNHPDRIFASQVREWCWVVQDHIGVRRNLIFDRSNKSHLHLKLIGKGLKFFQHHPSPKSLLLLRLPLSNWKSQKPKIFKNECTAFIFNQSFLFAAPIIEFFQIFRKINFISQHSKDISGISRIQQICSKLNPNAKFPSLTVTQTKVH